MPPAPELPYTEIAPPADLAPYVDRLWLRTTRAPAPMHRVLPDGCVDVIVDVARGAAEVVGAMTRALEVPGASCELIAVRFRPGTAATLTGCGLAELTDASVGVAELGLPGALADQVAGAAAVPGAPRLPARIPLSAVSHARLPSLDEANILYEVDKANEELKKEMGDKHLFSIEAPYGIDDERVRKLLINRFPLTRNWVSDSDGEFMDGIMRGDKRDPATSTKPYLEWERGPVTATTVDEMKGWVDTSLKTGAWLVLV